MWKLTHNADARVQLPEEFEQSVLGGLTVPALVHCYMGTILQSCSLLLSLSTLLRLTMQALSPITHHAYLSAMHSCSSVYAWYRHLSLSCGRHAVSKLWRTPVMSCTRAGSCTRQSWTGLLLSVRPRWPKRFIRTQTPSAGSCVHAQPSTREDKLPEESALSSLPEVRCSVLNSASLHAVVSTACWMRHCAYIYLRPDNGQSGVTPAGCQHQPTAS